MVVLLVLIAGAGVVLAGIGFFRPLVAARGPLSISARPSADCRPQYVEHLISSIVEIEKPTEPKVRSAWIRHKKARGPKILRQKADLRTSMDVVIMEESNRLQWFREIGEPRNSEFRGRLPVRLAVDGCWPTIVASGCNSSTKLANYSEAD